MKHPPTWVWLGGSAVLVVLVTCVLIAHAWYANLLARIGAKPIVTVLNDTGHDMTDVHMILGGCDFSTMEYRFLLIEPADEVTVTVDTGQEFSVNELTFIVEGVEYQLAGGGPSIGPGEHRVMVVDNGMGVVWRWQPPRAVMRPIRDQAVHKTSDSEMADEQLP